MRTSPSPSPWSSPKASKDQARAILPRTVALSHNKLCTVSRTVELGTPVRTIIE